jgi:hypothetical protein
MTEAKDRIGLVASFVMKTILFFLSIATLFIFGYLSISMSSNVRSPGGWSILVLLIILILINLIQILFIIRAKIIKMIYFAIPIISLTVVFFFFYII